MSGWSTIARQAAVLCGLLAVALAVVLMAVSHEVRALEEDLAQLNRQIAVERQTVRVLQAEFSMLTEPRRLQRLASAYLDLQRIAPSQLGSFGTLDLPAGDGGEASLAARRASALQPASRDGERP
jgi:cell division protein FtsL